MARRPCPASLHEVIDGISARAPGRAALLADVKQGEESLTYSQLAAHSAALASVLLQCGLVSPLSERPLATFLRRGGQWFSVYVAAMRCGVPMLAMSGDMGDHAAEARRNQEAFQGLSPQLLLYSSQQLAGGLGVVLREAARFGVRAADIEELSAEPVGAPRLWPQVASDALLAYCFTGGTTKASKAVRISHAMALHEVGRYAEVLPPALSGDGMRFLQNSSAYWGAALLGQIDVAVAMAGTTVMCDAALPGEITEVINRLKISCFGAVPSVLAHMSPAEVPTVECVISWAEELPDSVAARWRAAIPLCDLLIATEYWLALYAPRGAGRALRPVGGVHVRVLSLETSLPVDGCEVGELCLAGDTVCPGYADPQHDEGRFVEVAGLRYFRTRDLVRGQEMGKCLEYCGRCDDMLKVGGKWVDVTGLEESVLATPGVREAKIIAGTQERHAFVVLRDGALTGDQRFRVDFVRRLLPTDFTVHVMAAAALPRHLATGKVDRQALLRDVKCEDLATSLALRRGRVTSEFARAYSCAARFCRNDPRRMVCLAFLWYALMFCPEHRMLVNTFNRHFPSQGGAKGVMLAMARALPLHRLQSLAAQGAAKARAVGRGPDWAIVFWTTLPMWFPKSSALSPGHWTHDVAAASDQAIASVQVRAAKWSGRACDGCAGHHAVTLYPSTQHCCEACHRSAGTEHGPGCLQQPTSGWRKCSHCAFAVTWDVRFCCYSCQAFPGTHGAHCEQWPLDRGEQARPAGDRSVEGLCTQEQHQPPQQDFVDVTLQNASLARPVSPGPRALQFCASSPIYADDVGEESDVNGPVLPVNETVVSALVARVVGAAAEAGEAGGDDFGPLDSLRSLRLLGALQQDLGRKLALRDIASCTTVAQLTARVREAPTADTQQFAAPLSHFCLWTFGWNTCLQWLFDCDQLLDALSLRRAVARVVERHPALRLRMTERYEVQVRFMEGAVVVDLLREALRCTSAGSPGHAAVAEVQHALPKTWPRWRTPSLLTDPWVGRNIIIEVECSDAEVESATRQLHKSFTPPFQIALLRRPATAQASAEAEGAGNAGPACRVCVMLSHAIGDGSAIVPLVADLAHFCREELSREVGRPPAKRRLRQLPHFGAMLQDRFLRTLGGDDSEDAMFLDRRMDFFHQYFPEDKCRGYVQSFHVLPAELKALRGFTEAHVPGCTAELALLSLVVISLARVGGDPRVKFTLVHHGRDNPPGATDVVGFFTDFRTVEVPTSARISLLSVVSFVSDAARRRKWRRPQALEPIDILINLVPSPFERSGFFSQAPWRGSRGQTSGWHGCADGGLWQSRTQRSMMRQLECQIEQVDSDEWSVTMYLDATAFPLDKGQRFRSCWQRVLRELREDPLRGVLQSPSSSSLDGVPAAFRAAAVAPAPAAATAWASAREAPTAEASARWPAREVRSEEPDVPFGPDEGREDAKPWFCVTA